MTISEEFRAAAQAVVAGVAPATVRIGRDGGRGVGVVTAEGVVVTNAHNLRGPTVTVTFLDGHQATGEVRGVDADGDLAAIGVDTAGAMPVRWAAAETAIGTPVWTATLTATGGLRVTTGSVSALGRPFRGPGGRAIAGSIEHTAPLGRGSSGGALVDVDGAVVGLNTHRLGDGFYLALPTDVALQARVAALSEGRSPGRRRLGVALAPAEAASRMRAAVGLEAREGLLIRGVEDAGPAAQAGLRRGDLIVAAGGQPTLTPDDLYTALGQVGGSTSLSVVILRGTEELTIGVNFETGDATA